MAEKVEERWDGITTVSATVGIVIVTVTAMFTGTVTTETLYLVMAVLSGIGGYSAHNIVSRSGDQSNS